MSQKGGRRTTAALTLSVPLCGLYMQCRKYRDEQNLHNLPFMLPRPLGTRPPSSAITATKFFSQFQSVAAQLWKSCFQFYGQIDGISEGLL